jgi:penicillin-binding protein 1B
LLLRIARSRRPWVRYTALACGALGLAAVATLVYLWVSYGRLIDGKLAGEERPVPRVFGRPFELTAGQTLSPAQFVQRLNDVGYAERAKVAKAGEFAVTPTSVTIVTRPADKTPSRTIRAEFTRGAGSRVVKLTEGEGRGAKALNRLTLEAPLLAALAAGERRRHVPLDSIPAHVTNAVLAIEDRRFFAHPGVDPIGALRAVITNIRGDKEYLVGGSTLTQQIVKNTFLTTEKTLKRKVQEQFMALVLESRFTKAQILEIYLNDIDLGRRGPFAIRGVPEAARMFFGKDVRNLSLAEAATIAGVIQSPSRLNPFRNPERARERRDVVLHAMVAAGLATPADVDAAVKVPLAIASRALENEAPYFVDYTGQLVEERFAGLLTTNANVDVYTTLDLHLQRFAQEAVAEGVVQVDKQLAARKRRGVAQVALVAVDPRTGDILAMIGGRGYNVSQYNRAVTAQRQPGSIFKPFVYLTAFQQMAETGQPNLTPASLVTDEPTTFMDGDKEYAPTNYQNEYDGPITLRRALALSRNIVSLKVAQQTGYQHVADTWARTKVGTTARAYPSIALGVFEASPIAMAEAYTLFANGGQIRPLRAVTRLTENGKALVVPEEKPRRVVRPDVTYLVANMMRSVINEGTAASVRSAGFTLDAIGKTGTTNDLRDAWFAGMTPELLTIVWVGFDNNQPIGLSGSQAALPIWTSFMKRALAGRPSRAFDVPEGITFADIDKDTGQLATPGCPRVYREAFLTGTDPRQSCQTHGEGILSRFGNLLGFGR